LADFLLSRCFLSKGLEDLKPVKYYKNFKQDRVALIKENKYKSGVYCLINLVNGHTYVGSSVNLAGRMRNYLNNSFLSLVQNKNMPITKALLNYGQDNFAVLIVEYLSPDIINIRETYWIINVLPYYNVLKQGYSSVGYKHTEATKKQLSDLAKNRSHTDETKALIAKALTGENNPFYKKTHSEESKLKMIKANSAFPLYVYDSFKRLIMIYPSVKTLAKVIQTNSSTIINYIHNKSLFRGGWYFYPVPFNLTEIPLISDYNSAKGVTVVKDILNSSHIKKAVFVYNKEKQFIKRYQGVMIASKELRISHNIIKKHAKLKQQYKDYIFSYEIIIK
jgi:group I intron endonuclease